MEVAEQVSGYGITGIATTQLRFSIPVADYDALPPISQAEVKLQCNQVALQLPKYYINSRVKKGGKVTFTCLDGAVKTDQMINLSAEMFAEGETISLADVLAQINSQCHYDGVGVWGITMATLEQLIPKLKKENVYKKTIRSILELIASAMAGYWRMSKTADFESRLIFIPWGMSPPYAAAITAVNNAAIEYGGEKGPIESVIMTGSNNDYFNSGAADMFKTLKVNSTLASQAFADHIKSRAANYTYTAWSCSKIQLNGMLTMDTEITLSGNVKLICNYVKLSLTSYGIFASAGRNEVSENEFDYLGLLSRQIAKCIKDDERYNNVMVTAYQGIIFLAEDEKATQNGTSQQNAISTYSDAAVASESTETGKAGRYGFSVYSGGVTEYDGSMTSKVIPTTATVNDDRTEVVIGYASGKKYKYTVTYDTDGNITNTSKTEVTDI